MKTKKRKLQCINGPRHGEYFETSELNVLYLESASRSYQYVVMNNNGEEYLCYDPNLINYNLIRKE